MKNILAAIWAEGLKIRRSKMLLITILTFMLVPVLMGLMMYLAKNPELAHKFGILGAKATVLNLQADWPTYFGLLNIAIVGIGLVGFGFVTSWDFGREYSDHTAKDLLALPAPRSSIVLAKFVVVAIWCALLSLILLSSGLIAGGVVQLSGWTSETASHSVSVFAVAALLTILLCTPVAFFASLGRGYLAPVGFVILVLGISQFMGALGFARYFPWSIPMLYTGAAGVESAQLGVISYIILFLTSILGLIGTLARWRYADQY
ncbi:ABC transporter permease [Candidatus Cryosericum septentrionale]|jgi:ABC-type transport system involved in multi-copper enzyme maturation permease subunit|uniref:Bacitracin ABC transporter permease n=1 Tax=Candidatus Cryosericum septentrionale TaxID=2290913 RepID=A0A398DMV8_9BACT|nr:ABC transporter permease [Candidatus Cryosericum septentrionale]RIE16942.1 bacitracin ABC transporter permease [Candidatus Cryosericum septentrionale]